MSIESLFIDNSVAKLRHSTDRIAVCIGKLSSDQIWARGHENENAVGNLVLHLCGNVRQWIVSGLGGKPDVRVRDREFSATGDVTPAELTDRLRETVDEAAAVISALTVEQLTQMYEIQTRKVSGVEALMQVVNHFSEHTGQIIFVTKSLTGEDLALWGPKKSAGSRPVSA
jgi:uncharacterized damage-inducible protein DinB